VGGGGGGGGGGDEYCKAQLCIRVISKFPVSATKNRHSRLFFT
jgi:hypothetical protein